VGQHNVVNVLAAMTMAHAAGVELSAISRGAQQFAGLPNRCQWVANINGVDYYNDSKGTNVGATLAAVAGLGEKRKGRIVLIAGGMGKGADFRPLTPALRQWARAVVLIGVDGPRLATAIGHDPNCVFAVDLAAAVDAASELAQSGDAVLLSPACASFDMFRDFNHRGEVFIESVRRLI
jgi:UDP-N-acetylmuramoylalanine--D-glutamate ligase